MATSLKPHPKIVREFFFWCGIIATICYRAIVVLNHYSQSISLFAWYLGTIGFILYFYHRYDISEKRAELIRDRDLLSAVAKSNLSQSEQEATSYILSTLVSTKEKWNYIVIFVTSTLAIAFGIYLDFLAK